MKTALKLFALVFGLVLVFNAGPVYAAQVQNYNIEVLDTRPGVESEYTFNFNVGSAQTALRFINLRWCTTPSGTCTVPAGVDFNNATLSSLTGGTQIDQTDEWTLNKKAWGLQLENVADDEGRVASPGATLAVALEFSGIKNTAIDDCQPNVPVGADDESTDTCFIRLEMTNPSSTIIDEGVSTYTVVQGVQVTARVDPLFTFTISGVNSGVLTNGITTSVTSTYSTLPFSNLTAGTPKYAAHSLRVTTNTQSGYSVSHNMLSQMEGVYEGNDIDPFIAPYNTPTTWTEPTGQTPSNNTGWIGFNTNDADLAAYGPALFGPVDSTSRIVMESDTSDPGTTPVVVSYGLEANVFQPADTYTGTLIYIALPTY